MTKNSTFKYISHIIISIFVLILCSSCENFLGQKPQTVSSVDSYYQSEDQVRATLNSAYDALQSLYGTDTAFWAMLEMRSDNTTFSYRKDDRGSLQREQIDHFNVTTDNTYIRGVWQSIYSGIQQTNLTIVKAEEIIEDAESKNKIIAQAKLIRALLYFNLVRLWGDVPLVLEVVESPDEVTTITKQASVSEIYDQIVDDAEYAINNLPDLWPEDQVGRITKGAANTLLGELYLTQKKYEEATSKFEDVIHSGNYSLVPNYDELYGPTNKNNEESILEIQFSVSVEGEASNYIYTFAPVQSGDETIGSFSPAGGDGRNIPTRNMIDAYESGDKRKDASIIWYTNENQAKFDEAQGDSIAWVKKYSTKPDRAERQGLNFYVYRYSQVLLWYSEVLNEIGKTGEAYQYINKVRSRAGLNDLQSGLSQPEFRNAVYHEERVENAFEDHRWFQLLRTERAIPVMTKNGEEQKEYQKWLPSSSYDIQEYKLLFPIPTHNVDLNDDLDQNPGW